MSLEPFLLRQTPSTTAARYLGMQTVNFSFTGLTGKFATATATEMIHSLPLDNQLKHVPEDVG